jgi:hypothetical protein
MGWGFYLYNKPHTGVNNIKPDITIQADDLYKQYNENESAANKKFLNKVIAVMGNVDEIDKTDSTYIILLKKNTDMGGISCNLFNAKNATVQRGKTITVKGRCTGFLMDVALTDCVIEKQ